MESASKRQILRFLASGGAGVGMYYITLYSLTEFAGVWYLASAVVAFIVNWSTNFVLQKTWTFQSKSTHNIRMESVQYACMATGIFLTNTALLYVLVERARLHYLVAQVILTLSITSVSFLITRKIFSPQLRNHQ